MCQCSFAISSMRRGTLACVRACLLCKYIKRNVDKLAFLLNYKKDKKLNKFPRNSIYFKIGYTLKIYNCTIPNFVNKISVTYSPLDLCYLMLLSFYGLPRCDFYHYVFINLYDYKLIKFVIL